MGHEGTRTHARRTRSSPSVSNPSGSSSAGASPAAPPPPFPERFSKGQSSRVCCVILAYVFERRGEESLSSAALEMSSYGSLDAAAPARPRDGPSRAARRCCCFRSAASSASARSTRGSARPRRRAAAARARRRRRAAGREPARGRREGPGRRVRVDHVRRRPRRPPMKLACVAKVSVDTAGATVRFTVKYTAVAGPGFENATRTKPLYSGAKVVSARTRGRRDGRDERDGRRLALPAAAGPHVHGRAVGRVGQRDGRGDRRRRRRRRERDLRARHARRVDELRERDDGLRRVRRGRDRGRDGRAGVRVHDVRPRHGGHVRGRHELRGHRDDRHGRLRDLVPRRGGAGARVRHLRHAQRRAQRGADRPGDVPVRDRAVGRHGEQLRGRVRDRRQLGRVGAGDARGARLERRHQDPDGVPDRRGRPRPTTTTTTSARASTTTSTTTSACGTSRRAR